MEKNSSYRTASYSEPQVKDYSLHHISELLPAILDKGSRVQSVDFADVLDSGDVVRKSRKRLSPTNSERMNRALLELGPSAFKIHMLLWQWRGAPARGLLPFFTVRSPSRFCSLPRPTVRSGVRELICKGWIQKHGYNKHAKNELYRLIPIRDIPAFGV